jgi:hypothetical protein
MARVLDTVHASPPGGAPRGSSLTRSDSRTVSCGEWMSGSFDVREGRDQGCDLHSNLFTPMRPSWRPIVLRPARSRP